MVNPRVCVVELPSQVPANAQEDHSPLYTAAWIILNRLQATSDDFQIATLVQSIKIAQVSFDWSSTITELLQISKRACSGAIEKTQQIDKESSEFSSLLILESSDISNRHRPTSEEPQKWSFTVALRNDKSTSHSILTAQFDDNIYSSIRATQILRQYEHLILLLKTAKSSETLKTLELISQSDRRDLQQSNAIYPPIINDCVHTVIGRRTKNRPSAPAICGWDASFTYGELDEVANRLASRLSSLGVGPEAAVLICFNKSAWAAVSMLAILKAGGAIVAVDPTDSPERVETIISAAKVTVGLADVKHSSRLQSLLPHILVVNPDLFAKLPRTDELVNKANPENVAFIIFTSGSTGKPKGVVLEHRAICTSAEASGNAKHIDETSRVFQFSSYVFDGSIQDHFFTWIRGGCACIPSETGRTDQLAETINELNVNWTFLTPSVVSLLSPDDVPGLKILTLGGEALASDNVRLWASRITVQNTYGPAEVSVGCSVHEFVDASEDPRNIGFPIGSIGWVSNPANHNQLVPSGSIGELLLEGPMLARNYLDDPEKTAQSFITRPPWLPGRPSCADPRVYKTGDLVKRNDDGSLTFLGRKDDQVKLRGQRVAIADLSDFFSTNERVKHAHVSVPLSGPFEQSLVCVISLKALGDETAAQEGLRIIDNTKAHELQAGINALKEELSHIFPQYMVPTIWIPVHNLPLTPSSKIDGVRLRKWLVDLDESQQNSVASLQSSVAFEAPCTAIEIELQQAWSEELRVPAGRIGRHSAFIAMGGNSLRALALTASLRRRGWILAVAEILRRETLSEMAKLARPIDIPSRKSVPGRFNGVTEAMSGHASNAPAGYSSSLADIALQCQLSPGLIEDVYLATPFQEAMVSLSTKDPGAYTVHRIFNIPQGVDPKKLKSAWFATCQANPILRTRFIFDPKAGALQVVVKDAMEWEESASLDTNSRLFSFGTPMFRLAVSGGQIQLSMNHAIYDGWSIQLILDDVEQAYIAGTTKRRPSFKSFVEYLNSTHNSETRAFWSSKLSDISTTIFPALPGSSHQPNCTGTVRRRITAGHSRSPSITTATRAQAAWAIVLSRYVGSDDVCFGLILSSRFAPIDDAADIVGPLVATVPMRVKVQHSNTVHELLQQLQKDGVEMMPHAHYGLSKIQNISEETRRACKFHNTFIVNPTTDELTPSDILIPEGVEEVNPADYRTYPLHVTCTIGDSGLSVKMRFDPVAISEAQTEGLMDYFEATFKQINSSTSTTTVNEILQSPSLLPKDLNPMALEPTESCVHHLIEAQVKRRPARPAIASWDMTLTYAELNDLADRLAHFLRTLRVGPEVHVGFSVEKSALAVVAILGILKSGGACIPLDVSYPPDRVARVVEKCEAPVIVCSSNQAAVLKKIENVQLCVIDKETLLGFPSHTGPACDSVTSSNAAYNIFTSGSTGTPKGSTWEHKTLSSTIISQGKSLALEPTSRMLQFSAFLWDLSALETLGTLVHGGCICMPSEETRMNDTVGFMNENNVNIAVFTPSFARSVQVEDATNLKTIILAGEVISQEQIDKLSSRFQLFCAYGPSECCICVSIADFNASTALRSGNIGHPVGSRFWIVDANNPNVPVPSGAVGEILIEGPSVARGYLNDPERTASAFLTDLAWSKSTSESARRFYRSGDLARVNCDGTFMYLGRKDDQVKVRGQRLEPGEVEHHLLECPDVQHAMVIVPIVDFVQRSSCSGRIIEIPETRSRRNP